MGYTIIVGTGLVSVHLLYKLQDFGQPQGFVPTQESFNLGDNNSESSRKQYYSDIMKLSLCFCKKRLKNTCFC